MVIHNLQYLYYPVIKCGNYTKQKIGGIKMPIFQILKIELIEVKNYLAMTKKKKKRGRVTLAINTKNVSNDKNTIFTLLSLT